METCEIRSNDGNKWVLKYSLLFFWIVAFYLNPGTLLFCQDTGYKFMKNYTADAHKWYTQNWCILQDSRGCILVGNQAALLTFDGTTWGKVFIPNLTVRSMALDPLSGNVYVGGSNEIGVLSLSSEGTGSPGYVSLTSKVPEDKKNFNTVLGTHALNGGIYFRTYQYLFRYHDGQLSTVAETDKSHLFRGSFKCGDELYIRKGNTGLMQLTGGSLQLIPGGQLFASKKIFMLVPYSSDVLLIGTRSYGFYLYNRRTGPVPFNTGADDWLKKNLLDCGIRLNSGDFALGTRMGGCVIIDAQGKIKRFYTKARGLLENGIKSMFQDSRHNLWLVQDKGVSKFEHGSPFTIYDDRCGLSGMVMSLVRHGKTNRLYVGTSKGLFMQEDSGNFVPVPHLNQKNSCVISIRNSLLTATDNGVFQVSETGIRRIIGNRSYSLLPSSVDKNRIWVGTLQGLISLRFSGNEPGVWELEHRFHQIDQKIHSIAEDLTGDVWLGTMTDCVIKIDFSNPGDLSHYSHSLFRIPLELNPSSVFVARAAKHVMMATSSGIFRYDDKSGQLVPDHTLGNRLAGGSEAVFRLFEDSRHRVWLHSLRRNILALPQPGGTYRICRKPFYRLPTTQSNTIYEDPSAETIWFGGSGGLIRFETSIDKDYDRPFPAYIRNVLVNGESFFEGYHAGNGNDSSTLDATFSYRERNLRFQFCAPFFEAEEMIRFKTFMEGFDHRWTEPAFESMKEYTNLDYGTYTFRVKAENTYDTVSREATFRFRIMPPWYYTWWAFLIYAMVALSAIFLLIKWRSGKLEREKKRLELVVKQRTHEIAEKNRQLESQTFQLKEQSEKLTEMDKVKTRFFANISHEFRTPLTLIMGPLEDMIAGKTADNQKEAESKKLVLMLHNSRRLLNLINQLLELSKIESGKMTLEASYHDLIPFLKGIVASFEPVVSKYRLELSLEYRQEELIACFDAQKMEEIVFNLLSNAVKFTPAGGKITVGVKGVKENAPGEGEFPYDSVELSVSDTGPGIAREQLGQIFDRFYQSDSTFEDHKKGSGIGLAIAKELVELHGGKIDVHSIEGRGTQFIIRFPLPAEPPGAAITGTLPDSRRLEERMKFIQPPAEDDMAADTIPLDVDDEENKNMILIVEDSTDARGYIRNALEPEYRVLEAGDGQEGIEMAMEHIPDLIVSDVMMPRLDGFQLCRTLKSHIHTSHIPIILLTAKAGETDVLEGLERGADDYITKPFNTRILCARIKNLIQLRSHLQQALDGEITRPVTNTPVSSLDKEFIKKLKSAIKAHISDPEFNIQQLCQKMEMSQPTLYRKIHALSGQSPTDFIRSYRLKRGARLLEENHGSVVEVALEVGFSSAAYFTKCFKKKFNCLPSRYAILNMTDNPNP